MVRRGRRRREGNGGSSRSTVKRKGNGEVEPELGVDAGRRRRSGAPFIGPRREQSSQDAKGNSGRWWVY
jgi:hypothetical protein